VYNIVIGVMNHCPACWFILNMLHMELECI